MSKQTFHYKNVYTERTKFRLLYVAVALVCAIVAAILIWQRKDFQSVFPADEAHVPPKQINVATVGSKPPADLAANLSDDISSDFKLPDWSKPDQSKPAQKFASEHENYPYSSQAGLPSVPAPVVQNSTTDEITYSAATIAPLAKEIKTLSIKYNINLNNLSLVWQSVSDQKLSLQINPDYARTAASTIKLPLALILLDQIAEGEFSLQTVLTYESDDYEGGSGTLQYSPIGGHYSLKQLLDFLIVESDNVAARMLMRWLHTYTGHQAMPLIQHTYGLPDNIGVNMATAAAMSKVMLQLITNPKHNKYYDLLRDRMNSRQSVTFIGRLYPDNFEFCHKYGYYNSTYSEVAYIGAKNPFIMSVYLQAGNSDEKNITDFLADLGNICLNYAISLKAS